MDRPMNAFEMLVKPIRRLIEKRGFESPTEPQERAIPLILEGKNVLLISPTATGKTESAVLPVLNLLIQMPRGYGIKVLYITPLRALNRDILERLEWWCNSLDLKLAVRHGDTGANERRRQALGSPDVLITTPETLQAILPGRLMRRHLQEVRFVIVDEVHEMADSKRGSQLSLALERLRWVTNRDFQLIGLSATIGSPREVAKFLVGNGRSVEIVRVSVARLMRLKILYPEVDSKDPELASMLFTHPEVASRLRVIRKLIEKRKSVLLFTNTRAVSEILTSRFKVWDLDFPVSIHHGSLAKPSRVSAERGLKDGELKGLVATSSLELGIDVGRIDLVIQYMSPRQVTRLIQRVGRSGHGIGRTAEGIIITMDSDDTLETMVIAYRAYAEDLETVDVPPKPFDALTHQIAGLLMKRNRWHFSELHELSKKAYPYINLTLEDVEKVLSYMHSRFPRLVWVSFEDMLAIKPRRTKPLYEYYFENLSMIPYEKQYVIIDEMSDTAVGILDEAFVAEYGSPGVKFIIRGSPWEIKKISEEHVYVIPVDDPTGAIPSWIGEEIPVPFEVARDVGRIRGFVEEQMLNGKKPKEIAVQLSKKYPIDERTVLKAIFETVEHVRKSYRVPTDKRIIFEKWEDFIIIHANFGSLTNRSLAHLIGYMLSEKIGYTIAIQHAPYRIFIQTAGIANCDQIIELFNMMKEMPESDIRDMLERATVKTGLFKRRMVHVARRFGALRRWADFSKVTLQSLIKSFEGTVIYDEALKESFIKDLDMRHTIQVFREIQKGLIEIIRVENQGIATPIARLGIERVSMKKDIIPPERMMFLLVESAKARLLNEVRTFVCTNKDCMNYLEMMRLIDLPERPTCPRCGTSSLGVLSEAEDKIQPIIEKRGDKLTKSERKLWNRAVATAKLASRYGKLAAIALAGRRLRISDAERVLLEEDKLTNRFFEVMIEAEQKALRRGFW